MKQVLIALMPLIVVGCTTVHDLGDGRAIVPRMAEVRSPFGTNTTWAKLENCEDSVVAGSNGVKEHAYTDCFVVRDWTVLSSQGQGGQIAAGALNAAGLGILGAVMPSNGVGATQSQSITVTSPKGHR